MSLLSSCVTVIVFYNKSTYLLVKTLIDIDSLVLQSESQLALDPPTTDRLDGNALCKNIYNFFQTSDQEEDFLMRYDFCFTQDVYGSTDVPVRMCELDDDNSAILFKTSNFIDVGVISTSQIKQAIDLCLVESVSRVKIFNDLEKTLYACCLVLSVSTLVLILIYIITGQDNNERSKVVV